MGYGNEKFMVQNDDSVDPKIMGYELQEVLYEVESVSLMHQMMTLN
jgi:hypothetical protein